VTAAEAAEGLDPRGADAGRAVLAITPQWTSWFAPLPAIPHLGQDAQSDTQDFWIVT
jgi:hypothetical protein